MALPENVKTVKDLLVHIGRKIDYSFLGHENDRIEEDLEVIVNNKEIWFYPEAIDLVVISSF